METAWTLNDVDMIAADSSPHRRFALAVERAQLGRVYSELVDRQC